MNRIDTIVAARLLRYAAVPTLRPTLGSDYRVLLDRYRTDTEFADGAIDCGRAGFACQLPVLWVSSSPATATARSA